MRKSFILGSVAALAISGQALAEDGFSYTYLDLGYTDSELEFSDSGVDADADGDGFRLGGSFALTDRIHLLASYSDLDYEFDVGGLTGETSADILSVGGGVNIPLKPTLDFVGTLAYTKGEIDEADFDDDGFTLGAGLRGRVAERLELTGGIQYLEGDLSDIFGDTSFGVGARYFFTNMFALVADVNVGDDTTAWMLGGRFNFNK
jgi:hypothetical protein